MLIIIFCNLINKLQVYIFSLYLTINPVKFTRSIVSSTERSINNCKNYRLRENILSSNKFKVMEFILILTGYNNELLFTFIN